jgi:D-alanyl-D-alanine carboxypeptidase
MTARSTTHVMLAAGAFLAVVLAGFSGSTPGRSSAAASTHSDSGAPGESTRLDRSLAELVAMPGGPPGVIAIVQIGDDTTVHTAGVADLATGTTPTMDDYMRVASVAKAFSGATALSLVDNDRLDLDDTIGTRLPSLPAAWAEVTLRQLLSHTSGLPDFTEVRAFQEAAFASLDVAPPPGMLLTYAYDQPLNFPAGSEYRYSNSDNIAVGLMIEAATGMNYDTVLKEQVLDPLGLDSTTLPVGVELPEPALHGYNTAPPNAPTDVSTFMAAGWSWSSGGIVSTPHDLNAFIRGYVGGKLFGPETQAEQTDLFIPGGESGPPGPGTNAASLALFRYDTSCGIVYGHTGNIPGYTQFAVASPDGTRSATMSMTLARNEGSTGWDLEVLRALQHAEQAAICLLLEGN